MTDQKIGRYEILAEIGRGGMATVFKAHDPRFKRDIALKLLPRQFTHDPMFRTRFEREAETIAALEHPAIVPVYDFGEEDDQPYIVMRLMTGGSLADRIAQGPIPIKESARILERIGTALDLAHEKGIIHRDLKPGNILFDQYGEAYLADFGIARLAEASATLTGSGVVGTPAYMSPEQIQGGKLDGRTDVYALGIILFEMLTGQKPYHADTPAMILVKQMTEPVPRILDVKPELPSYFESVVAKAMAKNLEDRFLKASEVAKTLTSISAGELTELPMPPASGEQQEPVPPTPASDSISISSSPVSHADAKSVGSQLPWRWIIGGVTGLAILILIFFVGRSLLDSGDETLQEGTDSETSTVEIEDTNVNQPIGETAVTGINRENAEQVVSLMQLGRGTIETMVLSPDGKSIAVGGSLGVWLYGTENFEPQRLIQGHQDLVSAVAFSPDGTELATGSWDSTIRFWDINTGEQKGIITADDQITALAWSPDGSTLASSSWEDVIELWDAESGRKSGELSSHTGWVDRLSWGNELISGGEDGNVHLWDVENEIELREFVIGQGEINCIVWSPDYSKFATCSEDDSIVRVWDVENSDQPLFSLDGHEYGVYDATWSPDSTTIITAGGDNTTRIWEADTGKQVDLLVDTMTTVVDVTYLPDGERVIIIGEDGTLQVANVRARQVENRITDHTASIWSLTWSPDGSQFASANGDSTVRVWDARTGEVLQIIDAHEYGVLSTSWSPNGDLLATSGEDGFVRLWHTDEWWSNQEWYIEDNVIFSLDWNSDSSRIAMGDTEGNIHIWDALADAELLSWSGHSTGINDVVWSPDNSKLATSSGDGAIIIWDVNNGDQLLALEGHSDEARGLSWSPDSGRLASAGFDQSIRVWDIETGQQLQELTGHHELVMDIDWSPNGEILASVGWDHNLRLWDADIGRQLKVLDRHVNAVIDAAWSPDGSRLATGSDDGTVIVWGLAGSQ